MSDSTTAAHKHDLECLRLATDCLQLASDVLSPALQNQLVLMARHWTALAEHDGAASLTTH